MEDFKEFFLLLKEYIQKQKENAALGAAESMTKLLSAVATALIVVILGGISLLLAGFALAFLIGELADSEWVGFCALSVVMLLLMLLFWARRKQWILQPIARLMVQVFLEQQETTDDNSSDTK